MLKALQNLSCYFLLFLLGRTTVAFSAAPYTVSALGVAPGDGFYVPTSIDSSGVVVGFVDGVLLQSFVVDRANTTNIGSLGNSSLSLAYGMNDDRQVTGYSAPLGIGSPRHAFFYSNGTMTDLGSLGKESFGRAINKSGQVAGYFTLANGTKMHAFLYSNGTMNDIGVLPGAAEMQGISLNDSDEIVGDSFLAGGYNYHAFLYDSGALADLGTLGGQISSASSINDFGQIVGTSTTGAWATQNAGGIGVSVDASHAFLYSDGAMADLGTLGGDTSQADAINNLGEIVGESEITPGDYMEHAFLDENGTMIDLNSLVDPKSGWVLNEATAINGAGQIVGDGMYDGQQEAFLLTPESTYIPEPAAISFAAGFCFLIPRRRRARAN